MGGVGKTTLAKACYDRITSSNKGMEHLFVRNINEICEKHHGVEEIVHKLYSKLLKENNIDCEDLGISYRRERLSRLRVFIVLDNVETVWQLEQLALGDVFKLTKVFAAGSRIILTTRNKKVLQIAMAKVYNVECLNDEESTRLFSLHAFKRDFPQDNWAHKSRLAMSYCKGNPLALKILGGALFGEDRRYWMSFFSGLRQTGKLEIHNILRRSYNKLEEVEKRIFLDVACLLGGISRPRLIEHMATMHPSSYAKVKDLIDRSLLTCVSSENGEKIEVHDLLKEMAWNIVNEEPNLGKRSRLMNPEDIHKLLTTQEVKYWPTFSLNVTHCPEINSRELEVFDLKGTSLVELPSAIYNVKQDGLLYLSGEDITKLPAITTSLNDYWLDHTSIREMDFLNHHHHHQASSDLALLRFHMMYLTGNSLLESLSKSIWNVVSYQLVIDGSPLIESLPDISEPPSSIQEMKQLVLISLRGCKSLESIPSNIYKLSNLLKLHMTGCESIRSLPELPPNLEELEVSDCKSLQALPSNTGKLLHMDSLQFENCPQLDQTIPAEIVANFLVHASLSLSPEVRQYQLLCSRSELPKWFSYEGDDCSVTMELPFLKDSDQPMIKGTAIGAMLSLGPCNSSVNITCDLEVGNTTVASSSFTMVETDGCKNSSEKVWLMFDKNSSHERAMESEEEEEEEDEAWYVKYAGLTVSIRIEPITAKNFKIKRCGVSPVY
ncbi:Disease resistance-like protein DSC1 [Linum perenne]